MASKKQSKKKQKRVSVVPKIKKGRVGAEVKIRFQGSRREGAGMKHRPGAERCL